MIAASLAAVLLLALGVAPPKATEPKAAVLVPTTPQDLTPAVLDRLEKLSRMSGEERAQALGDLPTPQRGRIEKGLERLDSLTSEQRANWFSRYRTFNQLAPPLQTKIRNIMKGFLGLPLPRQQAVRQELETYKHMPMWARETRMKSADFRNKFNPEEREIVHRAALLLQEPLGK